MYVYHEQAGLIYARIEELKLAEFGKSLKSLRQLRPFWLRCICIVNLGAAPLSFLAMLPP
jgi:hypothetical protein